MNLISLDIRMLRSLISVVDTGSITETARRLGRTQPAISLQIQRLEDITGKVLFQHEGRRMALTAAEQASPLARRPYDLRHACLSTWLNGGVYPTQVAEWAGHGVDVLLRIYAKCVVGQDELAKRRISEALGQD